MTARTLFRDMALDITDVEFRYVEFRFDGERTISGVAMRYGDTAKMPWGDKERFEPRAFGDINDQTDIVLTVQHKRDRMLARSNGGDLRLVDTDMELRVEATMPETNEGNDALALIKSKVLRGFSVEFLPVSTRNEKNITVIEKAELRGLSIVDRPAYRRSRINRSERTMDEDTKKAIRAIFEELIKNRSDDNPVSVELLTRAVEDALPDLITKAVETQVAAQVRSAIEDRDAAQATAAQAEQERQEADAEATRVATETAAAAEQNAEDRAELIVTIKPLLADDVSTRGKSNKDMLVLAVGDEVEKAEERSEDYLLAKVEGILERRAEAETSRRNAGDLPQPRAPSGPVTGTNILLNPIAAPGRRAPAVVVGETKAA